MARYDYESTLEYAQQKIDEAKDYRNEQIEKQEKFSKRLLGFNPLVKGANYLIEKSADALNQSLAEEKAYLMNAQNQAKKIIEQDNNLINQNKSQKEWIQEQMIEQYRSQIEENVPGLTTQRFEDGKVIEVAKYDIPTSSLTNTKLLIDGKEISFNDLVEQRTNEWKSLVEQARSVPSKSEDLDAYIDNYVDREMPSNLFDWMIRPLRKATKNETSETFKEKLNRSTQTVLKNPMFLNFTTFQKSLDNYQENFPNQIVDLVNDFSQELKRDANGNVIDTRFNKIIESVDIEIKAETSTKENPETNKVIEVVTYTPQTKIKNIDGSTTIRNGVSTEVTTGEQILVKLNSDLLKTYETILSEKGMNAFVNHPMYVKNPMKAFNEVVQKGINEEGPNLYIKGDVNIGETMQKLFDSKAMQDLVRVATPISREDFPKSPEYENYPSYEEYVKSHQENIGEVITNNLAPIFIGLRNLGI